MENYHIFFSIKSLNTVKSLYIKPMNHVSIVIIYFLHTSGC